MARCSPARKACSSAPRIRCTPANIRRAMVYGSVTASFCCEGFGLNATTKATRKAIEQRVKELEKLTKF